MKKDSLEYLMDLYSVEDGNCFVTGPRWALKPGIVPARRPAGAPHRESAKNQPGAGKRKSNSLRLRAAVGK